MRLFNWCELNIFFLIKTILHKFNYIKQICVRYVAICFRVCKRLSVILGTSEKWDSTLETRDTSCGWDPLKVGHETRDPGPNLYVGPGILKVGPKTRDTYFTWNLRPETKDTEREIWDTYDRWDPRPKANISCRTWGARTMIQIKLIKFPINRIWVVIFLIFNHFIKRLHHL